MKRKSIRFYPDKYPEHQAILEWLNTQLGTDNENLISLMTLGLNTIESKTENDSDTHATRPSFDSQDLLPSIREVVEAAVRGVLRDGNFQQPQKQEPEIDHETQVFLKDMADNF